MGMIFQRKYFDRTTREKRLCSTWTIRYYDAAGKQCEEATGTESEKEARRLLRKREGDRAAGLPVGPEIGRLRFPAAVQAVYDNYAIKNRRTLGDVKRRVKLHLAPFFGTRRLIEITTDLIRSYTAERMAANAAPATVRLELAILKRAFRLASQANLISKVPYIDMPAVDNARSGFFESDQVRSLLAHLPGDIRSVVRFAFVTGWRARSEIFPLQWRQVDLVAGEVRLEPGTTKNRDGRTFVLTPALISLMEEQKLIHDSFKAANQIVPWVFPTAAGKRFTFFPRETWKSACKAAGCPGRVPHDFRRTAVRNLVRAGVPERVSMQLCGHKTRAIFDRYHIVSGGDLREASTKLAAAIDTVIATPQTATKVGNSKQRFPDTLSIAAGH